MRNKSSMVRCNLMLFRQGFAHANEGVGRAFDVIFAHADGDVVDDVGGAFDVMFAHVEGDVIGGVRGVRGAAFGNVDRFVESACEIVLTSDVGDCLARVVSMQAIANVNRGGAFASDATRGVSMLFMEDKNILGTDDLIDNVEDNVGVVSMLVMMDKLHLIEGKRVEGVSMLTVVLEVILIIFFA